MTIVSEAIPSEKPGGMAAVAGQPGGLAMSGIGKRFSGLSVLQDVRFDVGEGEIHAIVGQNGAGKSTLMKILSGSVRADEGEIRVDGRTVRISDPATARAQGVAIVHQEFALCPNLTVAENVFLGREPTRAGRVDFAAMRKATRALLERVRIPLDPDAVVGTLGVSEWQIVEICKALADEPRFIIMDEPTAALGDERVRDLLDVILRLRAEGQGIVYISHKLSEILAIADRVTVLRDGLVVSTLENEALGENDLVTAMLGGSAETSFPHRPREPRSENALEVTGLCREGDYSGVSFTVRRGEVVGLTGLLGSGVHSVMRSLFGIAPSDAGTIRIGGNPVAIRDPLIAIRHGLGYVPSDRKAEGLILPLSVYENAGMAMIDLLQRFGVFRYSRRKRMTDELIERLGIRAPEPGMPVANLSGGNQQKVSISKWLAKGCDLLMFDEPTRGIDIRAKGQVWDAIQSIAGEGKSVLVVSSELPELLQGCDRLLVMRRGQLVGEYHSSEFDEQVISVKAASDA